ncbi:MAG: cyclic nucleotide-binding domain-containing protein [Pseudomonadota bacterium]
MRRALYILAELDDGDVRWLVENGTRQAVDNGETLIAEGSDVDTLYIVTNGEVGVYVAEGKRVAKMGTGDVVGEMSLVSRQAPSASVRGLDNAEVLAVPQQLIRDRLEDDTAFAARFYKALAIFLSDRVREHVLRLGYGDTRADQAAFINENEIDEAILDNIHIAGDRMRRLLAMLDGKKPRQRRKAKA